MLFCFLKKILQLVGAGGMTLEFWSAHCSLLVTRTGFPAPHGAGPKGLEL